MLISLCRRLGLPAAAAGALALAVAGPASAHHCYKHDWQAAARTQLETRHTAWVPMSDLLASAMTEVFGLPAECAAHADEFVASWMVDAGVDAEPIIQTRATIGGGAELQGRDPRPIGYLEDVDFGYIDGLIASTPDCQP
jgi:hypothetical protein